MTRKMKHNTAQLMFILALAGMLILTPLTVLAESSTVNLANDHICITVNSSGENTGRFSVSTTGGDPDRDSDDNKQLIYRRPDQGPWTSYTSVLIDDVPWVYGGVSRDAGANGRFGQELEIPRIIDNNRISSTWQLGPILVTQTIRIVRSSTTGLLDTAAIAYELHNTDEAEHHIGLRVALDTMLGENDGAPIRAGDQAVNTDTMLTGAAIPDFWQAFDSLADPMVTAQGTLRGGEVSTPDRVYFTNWGSIAAQVWDIEIKPGRDFTRLGEFDLDSAMALQWDARPLAAGEKRLYVVYYGLGGMSISPGQLQIGIAAQNNLVAQANAGFQVVAYIMNRGSGEARDVVAELNLPKGLALAPGQALSRKLGNLPVGETAQVKWDVRLAGGSGTLTYSVGVHALNADSNELARKIEIISPAQLSIKLSEPEGQLSIAAGAWSPLPYPVNATITNSGQAPAYNVSLRWSSERGLHLASGDVAERAIGTLEPGQQATVRWHIEPISNEPGNMPYAVRTNNSGTPMAAHGLLLVPALDANVDIQVVRLPADKTGPIRVGECFLVVLRAHHLYRANTVHVELTYDPTVLMLLGGPLGAQPGTIFTATVPDATVAMSTKHWVDISKPLARVAIDGKLPDTGTGCANGTIAVFYMRADAAGTSNLTIDKEKLIVLDKNGQQCVIASINSAVTVIDTSSITRP